MPFAALHWSNLDWLWPALLLVLLGIALTLYSYLQSPLDGRWRFSGAVLKIVGFLAIAVCLLEPVWTSSRAKPGANYFMIAADNSQGLQIRDPGREKTRGELLRKHFIGPATNWLPTLQETFQVRRYSFDTRVQPLRDPGELDFSGSGTALGYTLQTLTERYQGQPLAGILLFTDGNATDLPEGLPKLPGTPPVYPIVLGASKPLRDVAVAHTSVRQSAFEDAPVTVQVDVRAPGYQGTTLIGRLLPETVPGMNESHGADSSGDSVMEEKAVVDELGKASFRYQLKSPSGSLEFHRFEVRAGSERSSFENPAASSEPTLANNRRTLVVDRSGGPYRILYVTGRPNWEFKFLNRALSYDPQVQMVGLLRIARREPKFEFKGYSGDPSNPLFRGFDRKDEETERYDQPVLIRLNTRDALELREGFPDRAEELFEYHAVIIDDLESEFFTRDQMNLIQKFVSDRGGGLLMLGGMESFQFGGYEKTPIADILPVYLDRTSTELHSSRFNHLQWQMEREGWLFPWARLRDTEPMETRRIEAMPDFRVLNPVQDLKPGASLVASLTGPSGRRYPALAVQRYGRGHAAALLVGDYWRWGLRNEDLHADLNKAWRQLVRWLVADVPERIELTVEPISGDPQHAVKLTVRARNKAFLPINNAKVGVKVHLPSDPADNSTGRTNTPPTLQLQADPSDQEPGVYHAKFIPRTAGAYFAEATVNAPETETSGQSATGWTSEPAAQEFESLQPNLSLLQELARQTGGRMLSLEELPAFAKNLPNQSAPVTETISEPLWHTPYMFLFALTCFLAEWGIRRWKGLA